MISTSCFIFYTTLELWLDYARFSGMSVMIGFMNPCSYSINQVGKKHDRQYHRNRDDQSQPPLRPQLFHCTLLCSYLSDRRFWNF